MAYIDDKLEQVDLQSKKEETGLARATLSQLTKRWGVVGGMYWMIEKKAPKAINIVSMSGEETWELDGDQPGINYKDKWYRKTK